MTNLIVAKRYAKALLEIGKEDGQLEAYGQDLKDLVALFDQSRELETVLANPAFSMEERQAVLSTFIKKLGLKHITENFMKLLLDRGRIDVTRAISQIYEQLLDEEHGIKRAEVVAATALDEEAIGRLKGTLKGLVGQEVQLEVKEDPSLIGGVVARVGDLVLDGSVKTQLENLKDSLRRGEYA